MAVCTNTEVFDFMGTSTEQRTTTRSAALTAMIANATEQFKRLTGRSPERIDHTSTAKVFTNGVNCDIFGGLLFLGSFYRDFYDITEIKEDGAALTEIVSSATQNNDYVVDQVCGKITRSNGSWLDIPGAIEIKGNFGLIERTGSLGSYAYPTRPDVKQIIIEMAAALSGLWSQTIITESGSLETTRVKISEQTQKALEGYILRAV